MLGSRDGSVIVGRHDRNGQVPLDCGSQGTRLAYLALRASLTPENLYWCGWVQCVDIAAVSHEEGYRIGHDNFVIVGSDRNLRRSIEYRYCGLSGGLVALAIGN